MRRWLTRAGMAGYFDGPSSFFSFFLLLLFSLLHLLLFICFPPLLSLTISRRFHSAAASNHIRETRPHPIAFPCLHRIRCIESSVSLPPSISNVSMHTQTHTLTRAHLLLFFLFFFYRSSKLDSIKFVFISFTTNRIKPL